MNATRWRGSLASFILPGAGQFFQGRRKPAIFAFAIWCTALPLFCLLLALPFAPLVVALAIIPVCWLAYLYFLIDAWRPTPPLGWKRWVLMVFLRLSIIGGEIAVAMTFCRIYSIPPKSNPMSPTIQGGDNVFCIRRAYWFSSPQRGDIVVFPHESPTGDGDEILQKRLVGLPGDVLELKKGELLVNGVAYHFAGQEIEYEPPISMDPDAFAVKDQPFTVPAGMAFVVGDNSPISMDSRYFGPIPLNSIMGKITVVIWPLTRVQRIHN
jgi:signal peptidase I